MIITKQNEKNFCLKSKLDKMKLSKKIVLRGAFNKFPDFFCTGIYNCRKLEIFQYFVTILLMR